MTKAVDNLNALISMEQGRSELVDTEAALNRITPEPEAQDAPEADDEGKAKFGTPEAVATAIAAGFVLGPLAGIVLGGAQGWLKQRADQSILDTLAADNEALADASAVYDDQLASLKESAQNPEDLEQIAALEAQREAALGRMTSGNADTRQAGMQAFAQFEQGLQGYTQLQETQRIDREAADKQLRVELDDRQYGRFTKLQDDFTSESAPYLEVTQAANTAMAALQSGSPADLHAAVILVNKALDPESVVRAEEAAAFGDMGGLVERWIQKADKLGTGETLNADQRRELGSLLMNIQENSTNFQLQREASYSDQIADADLPPKYHNNFRLVTETPAAVPLDIPDDTMNNINNSLDTASNFIETNAERAMQGAADWWDKTKEAASEVNKVLSTGRGRREWPTNQ